MTERNKSEAEQALEALLERRWDDAAHRVRLIRALIGELSANSTLPDEVWELLTHGNEKLRQDTISHLQEQAALKALLLRIINEGRNSAPFVRHRILNSCAARSHHLEEALETLLGHEDRSIRLAAYHLASHLLSPERARQIVGSLDRELAAEADLGFSPSNRRGHKSVSPQKVSGALSDLLAEARSSGASNIFWALGRRPVLRMNGNLVAASTGIIANTQTLDWWTSLMSEEDLIALDREGAIELSFELPDLGRFFAHLQLTMAGLEANIRLLTEHYPRLSGLRLPSKIDLVTTMKRGLVLLVGPANSGKTTTLMGLAQRILDYRPVHLITAEELIELPLVCERGLATRRALRLQHREQSDALRVASGCSADVVLLDELHDQSQVFGALEMAECGLLVLATMRTKGAISALELISSMFPLQERKTMQALLSNQLRMIVSHRKSSGGDPERPTFTHEIVMGGAPLAALLQAGQISRLTELNFEKASHV